MNEPEFSRVHDRRRLPAGPVRIEANDAERAALARRFGLLAIERLKAELTLTGDSEAVDVTGTIDAAWTQSCAVSGDPLPVGLSEPVAFRFVPEPSGDAAAEEIELEEDDLDEIFFTDATSLDVGEAIAQTLALAVDPYLTGPEADRVRAQTGLDNPQPTGPFAALAQLRKD